MSIGRVASWWRLARPGLWPFVLALVGLGYGAVHWDRALALQALPAFELTLLVWTLLHVGTLYVNAELDRANEVHEVVLMGPSAAPPAGAGRVGRVLLLMAGVLSLALGPWVALCAWISGALAWAYSAPSWAWKSHLLGGPAVNVVGYGLLSPLAGMLVVGMPLTWRVLALLPVVAAGVASAYAVAQAFQQDSDRARGDATVVAIWGPLAAVRLARVMWLVAVVVAASLAVVGWLPRLTLLVWAPWWWADRGLAAWDPVEQGAQGAYRYIRRVAVAVLLTGLALGWHHRQQVLSHAPPAGLGTVAGLPCDRPALGAVDLWWWERTQGSLLRPDRSRWGLVRSGCRRGGGYPMDG